MREGWEIQKLKEACQIRPPKNEAKEILNEHDLVSFVPMDVLGINKKYFKPNKEKQLNFVSSSYTYFKDKDVLLAKITPCFENGKLGIAKGLQNGIGFGSSEFIVYRTKENLNHEFLYYFLNQSIFREIGSPKMTGAVGHKRIPKEFYEEYYIPIPPIKEQKQIVTILDKTFAAIDKAKANVEKNLQNAKELFQSHLNQIFSQKGDGWEEKKLGEVFALEYGKPLPKEKRTIEGLYPVYGANGIKDRTNEYYVDEPSLIVGRKGSAGEINYTVERFWPLDVTYFTKFDKNKLNLGFLYHLLTLYELPKLAKGVKPGINRNDVYAIKTFIPPLEEQKEIVHQLDELSKLTKKTELHYEKKILFLEELKKSILQKAFAGELTTKEITV